MARPILTRILVAALFVAFGTILYFGRHRWAPAVARSLATAAKALDPSHGESEHGDPHDESASHRHSMADAVNRIELSEQAQQNIGLDTIDLKPTTFARTITVPGIVVEKPGHSDVEVTAPIAGVITQVYPLRGETVEPGDPLFRLRLTHEEVVQSQADLLKTTEELAVLAREIARIDKITEGVQPGKVKLERQYDQQKLEAAQRVQEQALVLHGLTEGQVREIVQQRRLLKEVLVNAPGPDGIRTSDSDVPMDQPGSSNSPVSTSELIEPRDLIAPQNSKHSDLAPPRLRRFYELESLFVEQGQHVDVGKPLARLGDHGALYIEGRAFEREARLLTDAVAQGWKAAGSFETGSGKPESIGELSIVYLSNAVDRDSRAFHFYVELPNELVRDARTPEGHRFVTWKYKPGQRVQLHLPVEQWPNRLVVPAEAVVQDGAETYVFQRNGDLFERRTVHLEYQDRRSAVLANDGSVFPGEHVVVTGAFQLHLAIKNKSGSGIDPHAGHSH